MTETLLAWRDSIASGTLLGPRILTSGPKLDGPVGGWEGSIRLETPDEVPAAIDSLQALGTDFVKVYDGSISADVDLAIVDEAERRGLVVTGHMPFTVTFLDAVRRGLDGTEHLYYAFKGASAIEDSVTAAVAAGELDFWGALWRMLERGTPEREAATYRAMAQAGTAAVPSLHIVQVLAWIDENDHQDDPELRYIPPSLEETYAGRVAGARRSSPATRRLTRELAAEFARMVPRMHAAGVTLLAGSDAGASNSYVYPGFSLHSELEALVAAGLGPAEAIRAATAFPADFMGKGAELGRVAPGYLADLVLLEANPLQEITATRRIAAVILRGQTVLDAADLQALLGSISR